VVSSRRLNVSLLALALFVACNWAWADLAADITASGLSADQVSLIETQTCKSWHARSIAGLRSESFPRTTELRE
jgi:cytochrome c553